MRSVVQVIADTAAVTATGRRVLLRPPARGPVIEHRSDELVVDFDAVQVLVPRHALVFVGVTA